MIGMCMPELILMRVLTSIITLLRNDLEQTQDEKETLLYKIMGVDENGNGLQLNLYNVFAQAKKMILNKGNLSINYGYNQKVAQNLSLHIILPSENATMAIGADEGYLEEAIENGEGNLQAGQQYFTQMYKSTYQIMIT